jgi:hypothetical protein
VGWPGLEPGTNCLKGNCSTIELPTQVNDFKRFMAMPLTLFYTWFLH